MDPHHIAALTAAATRHGLALLGAALLLAGGLLAMRLAQRMAAAALARAHADPALASAALALLRVGLGAALAIAVATLLGLRLGVLAGLLVALGSAVGFAAAGLLGDFAAGLVLLFLRPFEQGETIAIGLGDDAIEGEVLAIGALRTELAAGDGSRLSVPNAAITDAVLANRSKPAWVGVERRLQLPHGVDAAALADAVAAVVAGLPGLAGPPPAVHPEPSGRAGPRLRIAYGCADADTDGLAAELNRRLVPVIAPAATAAIAAGRSTFDSRNNPAWRDSRKVGDSAQG